MAVNPPTGHRESRVQVQPPLVGREAELHELREGIAAAREGQGRCVLISGVAGIGKTSLLHHAAMLAREAGLTVHRATGHPMESTSPFGVARQLLADTAAERLLVTERPRAGAGTVEELLRAVAALAWPDPRDPRHRALLLCVDDFQWSDRWSARFVAALADRADELPVLLLVALRPVFEEGPQDGPEPALARPSGRVLRPAALNETGVAKLLAHHLGEVADDDLVGAVLQATGGNPFATHAVAGIVRAGGREAVATMAPDDVVRSVVGRLAELGPGATALARALAVLGDGVALRTVARLAQLAGQDAEQVADAMAHAAILAPGEPLRFAHPLVASAVRAEQPAFAASRLHRQAADVLAAEGAAAELVGEHLVHARGEASTAVVALLEAAAAAALRRGDPTTAARFLQRALDEPPPLDTRANVLLELVEARTVAADRSVLQDARAVVEQLPCVADRVRALDRLANLAHHFGDFTHALALVEQGLAELPADERAGSALHDRWLATALLHPSHHRQAKARLHELIDAARGGAPPRSPMLCALAAVEASADDEASIVVSLVRAAFASGPLVDEDSYGTALGYAAAALTWVGGLEETVERMDAALLEAGHRGAVVAQAVAHHWRGIAGLAAGRLDDALADGERTAALHTRGWTDTAWSIPLLVDTWLARGELRSARDVADAGADDPTRPDHAMLLEARGRLRLAEHDAAGALEDALRSGALVEQVFGRAMPRAFAWRIVAADACRLLGRGTEARAYAEEAVTQMRPLGTAGPLGRALVALGLTHPPAEAVAILREAVGVLAPSPYGLAHTEALVALGTMLRRAGDRTDAREVLFEAFERAEDSGAVLLAAQARRELNALGHRPRRSARVGAASLTPSEHGVAELAAAGLSNPQIAHYLVISRSTVETHLARAYRKLGVGGRGDLAEHLTKDQ